MTARCLVLSDMHFGTPQSSINDPRFRQPLVDHIAAGAPWREIVFTGDLLDANLSTLKVAIEGHQRNGVDEVFGFRSFVKAIDERRRLADVAERWVYVPGNHDYKVWDLLATRLAFEDVLDRGERLGTAVPMPVAEHGWRDGTSFFAGMFGEYGVRDRVSVEYPNHLATFGARGDLMVLTHGHYLDSSQTRGNDLAAHLANVGDPARAKAVKHIVIETAQYQAVASAVSYSQDTQRLVGGLVGPDGVVDKLRKVAAAVGTWILKVVFARDGSLRGKALSPRQLENVETYVTRFCALPARPRWFVFGHTHRQGRGETAGATPIRVFNAGSCYADRGLPITFLEVDGADGSDPTVRLMCVDAAGEVRPSPGF